MTKRFFLFNSITGVGQLVLTAILSFISIPIFISELSLKTYGIFALLSIIGNLNVLANFGLNSALLVYLSKQGKTRQSDQDIIVTLGFMLLMVSIFTSTAFYFKNEIIVHLFSIPAEYRNPAIALFSKLIISNALLLIGQTFTSILDAYKKVYLTNLFQFIYSLIYWTSIIIIVKGNGSLGEIGSGILFSAFVWFLLISTTALKIWGKLDLTGISSYILPSLKKQIVYGGKIYVTSLIALLFEPLSKLLLSHYVGIQSVGYFDIGLKVKNQINGLISKAIYPLYPYIASVAHSDYLNKLLGDLSKKIHFLVIPISLIITFTFPFLIQLWLGNNNSPIITIFVIIMTVSMVLFSPSMVPIYQFLLTKDHAGKTFIIQLSSALTNCILFLVFYNSISYYAILVSNSSAFFVSFILCNFFQIKFLKSNVYILLKYYFTTFLSFLLILIVCLMIYKHRTPNAMDLLIYPSIVLTLYIVFLLFEKSKFLQEFILIFRTKPLEK